MILDQTIKTIINQILLEVKTKFSLEYSEEEIFEVINAQIEATKFGFKNGITIHWSRFCKFVFTRRGERKSEVIQLKDTLAKLKEDLSSENIETLTNNFIVNSAIEKKNYLAQSDGRKTNNCLQDIEDKIMGVNKGFLTFKLLK